MSALSKASGHLNKQKILNKIWQVMIWHGISYDMAQDMISFVKKWKKTIELTVVNGD